jgi:hypothetical protein
VEGLSSLRRQRAEQDVRRHGWPPIRRLETAGRSPSLHAVAGSAINDSAVTMPWSRNAGAFRGSKSVGRPF